MCVSMWVYMYVYVCVCMYVCVCVCMLACEYECLCVCLTSHCASITLNPLDRGECPSSRIGFHKMKIQLCCVLNCLHGCLPVALLRLCFC